MIKAKKNDKRTKEYGKQITGLTNYCRNNSTMMREILPAFQPDLEDTKTCEKYCFSNEK